ncbi:MAG: CPBP family intramembrane metalloprotease [Anaerolineaceae bacterium]|nr:CPBP family intramembrane metalloprotease [Anaerolineaceae bacterium]
MNSPERKSNNFIVRRPLLAYFVLSYTFFWGFLVLIIGILGMLRLQPDALPAWAMPIIGILGSWMPNLAAVTVTSVLAGREGIRQLLGKFFATRIAVRWYLIALFPFPLAFVAAGLYRLAGGAAPGNMGLSVGFWAGLIILNLLQGATGEEAGWRGFALPRLQETHGPVKASLILGLIWNFWHLPLWLLSEYSGLDLLIYVLAFSVSIISLTFLITWISRKTPNSLIPIVITHFSFNASLNLVDARGLGFGPTLSLLAITAGIYLVIAILVWSVSGWSTQKNAGQWSPGKPTAFVDENGSPAAGSISGKSL